MFNSADFDQYFYPTRGFRFTEHYRAFSVISLPGSDRPEVTYGGKIILPPSALEKLSSLNISYPMLFSIDNQSRNRSTHAGVLEFIAPEGRVYLPPWMMTTLFLKEGDLVQLKNVSLPLGTFVKIQPQSVDFLDITDPKAVLENAFRNFTTLTVGDMLAFKYGGKVFEIEVLEVKPSEDSKGISIIETDLSVDFAPPVGYVEPSSYASSHKMSREASILGTTPTLQEFIVPERELFKAFGGSGNKLKKSSGLTRQLKESSAISSGLLSSSFVAATGSHLSNTNLGQSPSTASPLGATTTSAVDGKEGEENCVPHVLNLPPGRLFFGYPIKEKKKKGQNDGEEDKKKDFGLGNTLKANKSKR